MEHHLIPDDDGKGFTRAFIEDDVEFVEPIPYWAEREIKKHKTLIKDRLSATNKLMAEVISDEFLTAKATEKWERQHELIKKSEVPPNFIELLTTNTKKRQIQLLKGQSLSPLQLIALIFKASTNFGYSLSTYHAQQYHKGLDESALPTLIYAKDGVVKTSGETTLTEGQLKNVIDQRRVVVSRFLDRGNEWHCFFVTYRSLRGEESWKNGQPHFHYISDKWGIPREVAVSMFKGEKYPSTSVHIDLIEYRDNTDNEKDDLNVKSDGASTGG
jgi:hypothetical protein